MDPPTRGPIETEVAAGIERELGREAAPFELSTDLLAIVGPDLVSQDDSYAGFSTRPVADRDAYDWLRATVRAPA